MRILVALGGNALQQRGESLAFNVMEKNAVSGASNLAHVSNNHDMVIVHGNGPQVGLLALQNFAYEQVPAYPLFELGAESQGMIGFILAQVVGNRTKKDVVTVMTRTIVDANDPAFSNPSKYVGPVYTEEQLPQIKETFHNWTFKMDGHYYRRVVPSPLPLKIVEIDSIRLLVDSGKTVIAGGGGGVPCIKREDHTLLGIDAVIDKDMTASLMAYQLGCDQFVILTDVDGVYKDFGTPNETLIKEIHVSTETEDNFPKGSMGPKVKACMQFTKLTGHPSSVGSLRDLERIIERKKGTHFVL